MVVEYERGPDPDGLAWIDAGPSFRLVGGAVRALS